MKNRDVWQSTLVTAVAVVVLSPLTVLFPAFRLAVFCRPAAWLSAAFLGAPCVAVERGYLVERSALPVLVSLACSGTGFFVLLMAMTLGLACGRRRLSPGRVMATAGLAYGVTLLANACRITLSFYTAVWSRQCLPESMWAGVHLSVGVLVFLSVLVGAYAHSERRLRHECSDV